MESEAQSASLRALKDREFLVRARQQLDSDHYGLDKIKRRLIEFLAVVRLQMLASEAEAEKLAKEGQAKVTETALVKVEGDTGKDLTQVDSVPTLPRYRNTMKGPILLYVPVWEYVNFI